MGLPPERRLVMTHRMTKELSGLPGVPPEMRSDLLPQHMGGTGEQAAGAGGPAGQGKSWGGSSPTTGGGGGSSPNRRGRGTVVSSSAPAESLQLIRAPALLGAVADHVRHLRSMTASRCGGPRVCVCVGGGGA